MADVRLGRRGVRDRGVEQAIRSLKNGAYLLKCGKRGKPKFCPFRLSTDERFIVWYAGDAEKELKLHSVTRIIRGQQTVTFLRQQLREKDSQSFSIIYRNGQQSLDLICRDREQAESWIMALNFLLSNFHHHRVSSNLRHGRGISTSNNPSGDSRKQKMDYLTNSSRLSRGHNLSGNPQSLLQRQFPLSIPHLYSHSCSTPKPASSVQTTLERNLPQLHQMVYPNFNGKFNPKILHHGHPKDSTTTINTSLSISSPMSDNINVVFLWGEGTGGALGGVLQKSKASGVSSDSLLPKLFEPTRMLDVNSISCGRFHAAIVTKHGEIFTWGEESGGRLGHKVDMDVPDPKAVDSLRDFCVDATSCGAYHTCALTSSGELYSWGSGCQGGGCLIIGKNRNPWIPQKISGSLEGIHISRVACGEWHTAVVTLSGQLFTFGDGTFGALGHGDLLNVDQPKQVQSLKGLRVMSVACGPWHTAAVVEVMFGCHQHKALGGKLFTWGDNEKGKLGHAGKDKKLLPKCVSSLFDCDFVQVCCGDRLTIALSVTGIVFTLGYSEKWQLGSPLNVDKSITAVEGHLKNKHVKQISCGSAHIVVLTTKREVYTWGKGANGRLGLGDTEDRNSPTLLEALKDVQVENITCGSAFTAAICLHKNLLRLNESECAGCKLIFSFTRKKHNCYNCGFAFCSLCTCRKAVNASLAPDKCRQFRVCDPCYIRLSNPLNISLKHEIQTPRALAWARKLFDAKTDIRQPQASSNACELEELKDFEEQSSAKKGHQDGHGTLAQVSSRAQRWGEVSFPSQFIKLQKGNPRLSLSILNNGFLNLHDIHVVQNHGLSRPIEMTPIRSRMCKLEKSILVDELERLQTEVKNLTNQCQMKGEKLLYYKQKIDETRSAAREEAAKCKAAKDIVKVLTCQINASVGRYSNGKELNLKSLLYDNQDLRSHQIRHAKLELLDSKSAEPLSGIYDQSLDNLTVKHEKINLICGQSLRPSNVSLENSIRGRVDSCPSSKAGKEEITGQEEPDVFVTFTRVPNGRKGLRRVRFGQEHFT